MSDRPVESSHSDARDESAPRDLDPMAAIEAGIAHATFRLDPVTLAVVKGLSRRAAQQHGEAQRVMASRVAAWLAKGKESAPVNVEQSRGQSSSNAKSPTEQDARPDALAGLSGLVDRLGRSSASTAASSTATAPSAAARTAGAKSSEGASPPRAGPGTRSSKVPLPPRLDAASPKPLKSVTAFKATWSRLRAEQRLRQVLAQVPAMAGPLNSAHVVNRALQAMRELSPQYLDAFILHVDALLWLEQSSGGGEPLPRTAAPSEASQRSTRKG